MLRSKVLINDTTDVFTVRMQARQMAKQMGFGTIDQARIALATSELAHLICASDEHSGEIVLSEVLQNDYRGFQVACWVNKPADEAGKPIWSDNNFQHSVNGACRLVDENIIDLENHKGKAQITLIKWCR